MSTTKRERRKFWYVSPEFLVFEVEGHRCNNEDSYWWCPSVGVSAHVGHSLFVDRRQALEAAFEKC